MIRLLADENFPQASVAALQRRGYDVETLLSLALAGQAIPDDEVLRLASRLERCLLTFNRKDFIRLHAANAVHAGVIICKFDTDFEAFAQRVHDCLLKHGKPYTGQLLRVQRSPS